jgi:hypothetical protein
MTRVLPQRQCMFRFMSGWRVLRGALACAVALGCGERAGDPIVRVGSDKGAWSGGAGGTGALSQAGEAPLAGGAADIGSPGAGGGDAPLGVGLTGLCGACRGSDECGDENDACIAHNGERFCGNDCSDGRDCPDGYACVELANIPLYQCVPTSACPEPAVAPPSLSELRGYLLTHINEQRGQADQPPLDASSCLDQLAQESALGFAATDEPLGKYAEECHPIRPNCACGWRGQAEISIARYGLDWLTAADLALGSVQDTQSDAFVRAFLEYAGSEVGIGIWISGDEAWIALSFG